jgi:hypothetical protein
VTTKMVIKVEGEKGVGGEKLQTGLIGGGGGGGRGGGVARV